MHCFDGIPKLIQVIGNRILSQHKGKEAVYDTEWNRVDMMYHTYEQYELDIPRPEELDTIIEIAGKLSNQFKYARVDLYVIDHKVKFGEMTFTPAKGFTKWASKETEAIVGSWIICEPNN